MTIWGFEYPLRFADSGYSLNDNEANIAGSQMVGVNVYWHEVTLDFVDFLFWWRVWGVRAP